VSTQHTSFVRWRFNWCLLFLHELSLAEANKLINRRGVVKLARQGRFQVRLLAHVLCDDSIMIFGLALLIHVLLNDLVLVF